MTRFDPPRWQLLLFSVLVTLVWIAILGGGCATSAHAAGEVYVSAAKTLPSQSSHPTGLAAVGYRSGKLDVMLTYAAESEIYDGTVTIPDFFLLSVSRVWTYERTFLGARPEWHMGLSFKEADRCARNHELNCNRRLPLPVSFHFGLGLEWKDVRLTLYHDSNNAMDYGPEKKNLGLNWLSLSVRF